MEISELSIGNDIKFKYIDLCFYWKNSSYFAQNEQQKKINCLNDFNQI